jgi:hypothetical protein
MKSLYLLPNSFKKIGIILFIPFFVASILLLAGPGECEYFSIPVFSFFDSGIFETQKTFTLTQTDPINELTMIGLLVSIAFIALSKEKDEDEMTPIIRQNAFVWSFWATIIVDAAGIIFIYGLEFLTFSFAALYLYFIFYIIKFNMTMYKLRREQR